MSGVVQVENATQTIQIVKKNEISVVLTSPQIVEINSQEQKIIHKIETGLRGKNGADVLNDDILVGLNNDIALLQSQINAISVPNIKLVGSGNKLYDTPIDASQDFDGTNIMIWHDPIVADADSPADIQKIDDETWRLTPGVYLLNCNVPYYNTTQARPAPAIRPAFKNSGDLPAAFVAGGPVASTGYIRDANAHQDASGHIAGYPIYVPSGTTTDVQIWLGNKSFIAAGDFQAFENEGSISFLKIS